MSKHETEFTEFPVCPDCGATDKEWWDGVEEGVESWTASCPYCGYDYEVTIHTSHTFTTTEAP